ncbi:MAG: NADH-quinone oxidoreductase subunit H [Candidatus Thorarchaeota archaeon]
MSGGMILMQVPWIDALLAWVNAAVIWWLAAIVWWIDGIVWIIKWILDAISWVWRVGILENVFFWFKAILFPGLIFVVMGIIFAVWASRKTWGRFQARRGPFHIGKYGGLQLFADAIKLVAKETIIPANARRWMYRFLPGFLLVIVVIPFIFIPWDSTWAIMTADLSVSLVLVFAFLTAVPVISLLAGWISGSKYSLIGGFRAANNQFAAEIPMVLSTVGPAMLAGSLSLGAISAAQANFWFIFLLPISFVTFLVSAVVSVGLVPMDAPVADSEVIFGWRTEFSGIYFTMTYFAEFAEQLLYCALMVALFFGGSSGLPFLPGVVNFIIKWLIMIFFFILVTSSFYRIRQDQIVRLCWKYLLPLSLLNIVGAMFAIVYFPQLQILLGLFGG